MSGSEPHDYLSTSCLHGLHERCEQKGARCKFCEAPCRCACHVPWTEAEAEAIRQRAREMAREPAPSHIGYIT